MGRTKLKVAAGVFAGALASGGLAYAAIPAADGTITACFTQSAGLQGPKGSLRVVDAASQCRAGETALTWGRQGLRGPDGPAGPAGPAGAAGTAGAAGAQGQPGPQGTQGPAGPAGVSGRRITFDSRSGLEDRLFDAHAEAVCADGQVAIGGAAQVVDYFSNPTYDVAVETAISDGGFEAWAQLPPAPDILTAPDGHGRYRLDVQAICVNPS
jgi:hypothetical protein